MGRYNFAAQSSGFGTPTHAHVHSESPGFYEVIPRLISQAYVRVYTLHNSLFRRISSLAASPDLALARARDHRSKA